MRFVNVCPINVWVCAYDGVIAGMNPKTTLVGFFSAVLFGGHTKDKFGFISMPECAKHTQKIP